MVQDMYYFLQKLVWATFLGHFSQTHLVTLLATEDVGIVYGHLVHFMVFCYILWTFGIVRGNLVYFFPFWYFIPRKIWQPSVSAQNAQINICSDYYGEN
jgi:hypothetical protein